MARTALIFIIMQDYSQHTPWDEQEEWERIETELHEMFDSTGMSGARKCRPGNGGAALGQQNKILDDLNAAISKVDDAISKISVPYYDLRGTSKAGITLTPKRVIVDMRRCHRCPCCHSTCEAITWGQ